MSDKIMLSILALYNWDNTIFDEMKLPEGIDRNDVIGNLLLEMAEFEILYPNPETMKTAIGFWSRKELPIWEKMYETTRYEYEPLDNLFRKEEHTDTETRNLSGSNTQTRNLNGSVTNNGTDIQNEYVTGFNAETQTLSKKNEQILGSGNTTTDGGTVEDASTDGGTIVHKLEDYMHGSIGVITPQDMIEKERKVGTFNISDYIIDSFKRRFCIMIY